MKTLKSEEIKAYAASFVSFILPKIIKIDEIILFGSAARGDADEKSDIDLFFSINNNEDEINSIIKNELVQFYKSKIAETWSLKGIKNPINIHVGKLSEWKLKRSVISEGIVLYGKYKENPNNLKPYVYFNIKPIKNIAKRNKIIRKLYGRKEKKYNLKGIIEVVNGKIFSPNSFIVPLKSLHDIGQLLNKEKINYAFFEFWTDVF